MLTVAQRALIGHFSLGMVATIRPDGGPAVSPKGTFVVLDERHVAFADIRSPGTMRNLRSDPRVEVNFADPFARKAVRLRGQAVIHDKGTTGFAKHFDRFDALWPSLATRIRALIVIELASASTILTPPYDDGATEAEMIKMYQEKYAEIYP